MPDNLHAALLDECRRLAEIAPDELQPAVSALRGVVGEHPHRDRNQRRAGDDDCCETCGYVDDCGCWIGDWPCSTLLAMATALGIGADHG